MFYTFSQNNSGGTFIEDDRLGIASYVIVEADDPHDALYRAERIGLYFDGSGDCECCGDRWSDYIDTDGGDQTPQIYGRDVVDGKIAPSEGGYGGIEWTSPAGYIHYKDGNVEPFDF